LIKELINFFFLKRRQKICLNLLIKKKRIAQLINGKPGENRVVWRLQVLGVVLVWF
jgi:hypothetical protein